MPFLMGHSKSRNWKLEMGNEKWETRKWGNGMAMYKWRVSVKEDSVFVVRKVVKESLLTRGGRPIESFL